MAGRRRVGGGTPATTAAPRLGEGQPQQHRRLLLPQEFGRLPGIPTAEQNRLDAEFPGELQRALNLIPRVGFHHQRLLTIEHEGEFGECRVEGWPFADPATVLERLPEALMVSGVQQGLPGVGHAAHQGPRIIAASRRAEGQVLGKRGAEHGVPGRSAAQAHERTLPHEEAAVRGHQVAGEAEPPPVVRLLVVLQGGGDLKFRRHAFAVVHLGRRQRFRGQVFDRRGAARTAAQGIVVTPVAQRIEKAGVDRQARAVRHEGIGGDFHVRSDGLDNAIADDDRGPGQDFARFSDDLRVADGEHSRAQAVGALCLHLGGEHQPEQGEKERMEEQDRAHGCASHGNEVAERRRAETQVRLRTVFGAPVGAAWYSQGR